MHVPKSILAPHWIQANVTQTGQNSSVDIMKHLFICAAVIVSLHTLLA